MVKYRTGEALSQRALFGVLAAIYTVAVLIGFAGDTRLFSPHMVGLFFSVAWLGPFLAVVPFLTEEKTRWVWVGAVLLFGGVVTGIPSFLGQQMVLSAYGVPLHATISSAQAMDGEQDLLYTLKAPDGTGIPGLLAAQDSFRVGDQVDVVVDPNGIVHPMLADGLAEYSASSGLTVFGIALILHLVFCWMAAKPRGQRLDVSARQWMRRDRSAASILEGMPWWQLSYGAFIALLALGCLLSPALNNLHLSTSGVSGTVEALDCSPHYNSSGQARSWTCSGPFRSDDGSLQIARVTIEPDLAQRPDRQVTARVSGAEATVATTDPQWIALLVVGLVVLAIGIWRIAIGLRLRTDRDRGSPRRATA